MNMKNLYEHLPETPGVYIMKNALGEMLYIGKATNLKRRVSSYFRVITNNPPKKINPVVRAGTNRKDVDPRIRALVEMIAKIEVKKTDSALEALILESELIKKNQPPFNVQEKDDKSFLYVAITKDKFPRIILVRGKDVMHNTSLYARVFGPFVSASSVREALRIIRKIFPWNDHLPSEIRKKKPCFNYQIGLCPGTCIGKISEKEYKNTVEHIISFFEGKKGKIMKQLGREMRSASKKYEYEHAEKIKRQIFALQHINDTALISSDSLEIRNPPGRASVRTGSKLEIPAWRVEGYDISNISGTYPVGVMVVFSVNDGDAHCIPEKNEYRKFNIKTIQGPNDVGMIREVIERRFHNTWKHPDLILVDGGLGQVNVTKRVLREMNLHISVIGMAKGTKRKRTDIIGKKPSWVSHETLVRVRDEAHRFAVTFHRKKRGDAFIKKM